MWCKFSFSRELRNTTQICIPLTSASFWACTLWKCCGKNEVITFLLKFLTYYEV